MLEQKSEESFTNNNLQYFSYFNHKLYESPIFIQEEEKFTKLDINNQSIEDSSDNTSHQSENSIDDEDKYIPLNLLDLSPKKKSIYFSRENEIKPEEKEIISDKNDSPVKEIKPELQKYILPKSLFNLGKNKKLQKENKTEGTSGIPCPSAQWPSSQSTSKLVNQLNLLSKPFVPKYKIVPVLLINNPSFFNNNNNNNIPVNNNGNKNKNYGFNEKKKKKKNKEFVEREGDWSCYRCKNINFAFRNKCNKCKYQSDYGAHNIH